jgi:hypothetical protein
MMILIFLTFGQNFLVNLGVSHFFEMNKNSFNQVAGQAVNSVNEATSQLMDTISKTSDKGKAVVGDTLQIADNLSNTVSAQIEKAINSVILQQIERLNVWIAAHPGISGLTQALIWGINHPILSLLILFFAMFILWQLFKVLGRLVEQALAFTLKAPFQFARFLFNQSFKFLSDFAFRGLTTRQTEANVLALNSSISDSSVCRQKEQVETILRRIEELRQEQNYLLQELKAILALDKSREDIRRY